MYIYNSKMHIIVVEILDAHFSIDTYPCNGWSFKGLCRLDKKTKTKKSKSLENKSKKITTKNKKTKNWNAILKEILQNLMIFNVKSLTSLWI